MKKNITVSYFQLRTIIGLLGIFLPVICIAGTVGFYDFSILDSISMYYYTNIRDVFVGIMICISIFLITYHGYDDFDNVITNIIGAAGILIAWFPCQNLEYAKPVSLLMLDSTVTNYVHLAAVLVFFTLLSVNSIVNFTKSDAPVRRKTRKYYRNALYRVSGIIILACLVILILITIFTSASFRENTKITLVLESIMLLSFGVSWLVKGGSLLRDKGGSVSVNTAGSERVAKKSESLFLFVLGILCAVGFLRFQGTFPLPLEIALKVIPTMAMCVWMLINRIDKTNWTIFTGLIFSIFCDISMSLPGELFITVGIGCNMLALIFFTIYFIRSDPSLDLARIIPFALIMGILFVILYDHLGANKLPVLAYCILYIAFLWRASARLGEKDISIRSQLICFFGSLLIAASDSFLSMVLFGVMRKTMMLQIAIMGMWWTGLLLLMVTAELKKRKNNR